jgi:cytochrome c-type biogenesis protein CcmE
MHPARKRKIRLVAALGAALLLAGALMYTSFTASSPAETPGDLVARGQAGRSYQLTGKVVAGYRQRGNALYFRVRDRTNPASVPVRYVGEVPDPFRAGREIIITVRKRGSMYVGEPGSLTTKCPSKFKAAYKSS